MFSKSFRFPVAILRCHVAMLWQLPRGYLEERGRLSDDLNREKLPGNRGSSIL